jgi:hypothetical protein
LYLELGQPKAFEQIRFIFYHTYFDREEILDFIVGILPRADARGKTTDAI